MIRKETLSITYDMFLMYIKDKKKQKVRKYIKRD